jgi:hypothetical protein
MEELRKLIRASIINHNQQPQHVQQQLVQQQPEQPEQPEQAEPEQPELAHQQPKDLLDLQVNKENENEEEEDSRGLKDSEDILPNKNLVFNVDDFKLSLFPTKFARLSNLNIDVRYI